MAARKTGASEKVESVETPEETKVEPKSQPAKKEQPKVATVKAAPETEKISIHPDMTLIKSKGFNQDRIVQVRQIDTTGL